MRLREISAGGHGHRAHRTADGLVRVAVVVETRTYVVGAVPIADAVLVAVLLDLVLHEIDFEEVVVHGVRRPVGRDGVGHGSHAGGGGEVDVIGPVVEHA